jgi:hypothetical protein
MLPLVRRIPFCGFFNREKAPPEGAGLDVVALQKRQRDAKLPR